MLFIGSIRKRLTVITRRGKECAAALQSFSALGVVGGAICDAMLAQCAIKEQAETILIWNSRHYAQCGTEVARRLRTP